jgi:hypothetical protein
VIIRFDNSSDSAYKFRFYILDPHLPKQPLKTHSSKFWRTVFSRGRVGGMRLFFRGVDISWKFIFYWHSEKRPLSGFLPRLHISRSKGSIFCLTKKSPQNFQRKKIGGKFSPPKKFIKKIGGIFSPQNFWPNKIGGIFIN